MYMTVIPCNTLKASYELVCLCGHPLVTLSFTLQTHPIRLPLQELHLLEARSTRSTGPSTTSAPAHYVFYHIR